MDYLDKIKDYNRNFTFDKFVKENYINGVNLVAGGKIFGVEIDTTNLEEVIAALYVAYTYKEYLVKIDKAMSPDEYPNYKENIDGF